MRCPRWLTAACSTPGAGTRLRVAPLGIASVITRPISLPFGFGVKVQQPCRGGADIGVADGQGIDIAGLELGLDRCGEIHGVTAAEAAMHARRGGRRVLAIGVGGTVGRLFAAGRPGTEIDHDRRVRRHRLALRGQAATSATVPGKRPRSSSTQAPAGVILSTTALTVRAASLRSSPGR